MNLSLVSEKNSQIIKKKSIKIGNNNLIVILAYRLNTLSI